MQIHKNLYNDRSLRFIMYYKFGHYNWAQVLHPYDICN